MNRLVPYLWAAAVLQWLVAASNLPAARLLGYRENMQKVAPLVREIFYVQNLYIVGTVAAFGALCIAFGSDLAGGSALGRSLSGFLAVFWGGRIVIQLFVYDREIKRSRPVANAVYLATFVYLCGVFTLGALGVVR